MGVYEFPASFGQRRMWLLDRLDPGEATYTIAWALWLDGDLDVPALSRAWDAAVLRHEALRTTFRGEADTLVQVIREEGDDWALVVEAVDGSQSAGPGAGSTAPDAAERAARNRIRDLARAPMDLAAGPLVQARLVRIAPDRHVLAVVMHHIIADGWSFRILFDQLAADYEAIRRTGGPTDAEPSIQYADFAIWQVEHADEGGFAAAERFWRTELAGAPTALPLPTDEPYPARQTFAAGHVDTVLGDELAGALRKAAAGTGTTVFAVLLAAYALVLARLTGEDDLLIAVPMAARNRPETEDVVGLFMNTVTLRVRVDEGSSLRGLVQSVHAATARALEHQELPFARVVELLRPERDPARLPLVQVMFAMEESWDVPDRGGLRWRPELLENGTTKFELELTVTDAESGPRARVTYNSDLFHAEGGRFVADAFRRVLGVLADDPGRLVGATDVMTQGTYALVTGEWPDAGPVPDAEATALRRLWDACGTFADRVLIEGADGTLTGAEIRRRAGRVAAGLRGHGIGAGDRVAILVPRGCGILPAVLGVWSVGAAYLPLDAAFPERRMAGMLADAGARAIVVDRGVEGAPAPPGAAAGLPVVDLAGGLAGIAGTGDAAAGAVEPVLDLPPTAAAYVLFTSGSTGRPKAVTVPQGAIAALLDSLAPLLALTGDDLMVAVATFAFDISVLELLLPAVAGARVLVADADQARDAGLLRRLLADSGATVLQGTPATWRMLVDAGGVPAGVRTRISGGEALSRDLADSIGGPDVRLWNLYGPTETTVYSGGAPVGPRPEPIGIGSLIGGTRLYVLGPGMRPTPPGVLGEVYIGGAGVATGYHGAAGLTAARFVPDPFGHRPGARLYRSGDVGRWRWSGRLEIAGRADRQLKIRGYRVESGEVEAALRAQPEVAEAVVSLRGSGGDVRLVGYLVLAGGAGGAGPATGADTAGPAAVPPDLAAGLRERLRDTLPDYMVPSAFVAVPALPKTASGKLDERALPEPDWRPDQGTVTEPRTPVEAELAAVTAELLDRPAPVGVLDNFFALGGHSLTASRLMARIRGRYGVDLPVRVLFADPTVAALAAAVDRELARSGAPGSEAGR